MEKCIYCDKAMDKDIWEEEGNMCLECSNLFYDHKINPYDPDTYPKNMKEDICYVYGIGSCGFFGNGSSLMDMVWSSNIVEAIKQIRSEGVTGIVSIRKAVFGEFDCNSFTLAGHQPHTD